MGYEDYTVKLTIENILLSHGYVDIEEIWRWWDLPARPMDERTPHKIISEDGAEKLLSMVREFLERDIKAKKDL